jgi:hypothetical protein
MGEIHILEIHFVTYKKKLRVNGIQYGKTEQIGIDKPEQRETGSFIEIG